MSTPTPAAPAAPAAPSTPAAPQAPAAPSAPAAPATPPAAPPSTPPAPTTPPAAPAAPAQGEPQDVSSLPQWAQDHIRSLRTEAADYRTRAQGAAPQAPAAPAAPIPPAPAVDGDVSRLPQWAQRIVTDSQTAARQAAVQSAVYTTAAAAGADPAALLDSQTAMNALAAVDPADQAAVTAAITAAVQANPRLAAQPTGPARAGADFSNPGVDEITPARFAAMGYAERAELYRSDPETYRRLAGT
ncbi:Spy/CpxP family protein refolding chaperone [Streptomyces sp. SAI-195]|uniref:hypothetical protein n=1 Tax=Streptomyces sp. SAI-195 TaxID=3377734 RepID=UPI003C7E5B01